jgi:hypothetical protein
MLLSFDILIVGYKAAGREKMTRTGSVVTTPLSTISSS